MKRLVLFSCITFCFCGCIILYEGYEPSIDMCVDNHSKEMIATISKYPWNYVGARDTLLYSDIRMNYYSDSIREWFTSGVCHFASACQLVDGHYNFDTLSIFIISYSTYKTKSWEQIAEDYDILARYDITNENVASRVEGNSGKIILPYPPNEDISDIYTYVP